jgi:hypothetical protein
MKLILRQANQIFLFFLMFAVLLSVGYFSKYFLTLVRNGGLTESDAPRRFLQNNSPIICNGRHRLVEVAMRIPALPFS